MSEYELLHFTMEKDLTPRDIAMVLLYVLDQKVIARTDRESIEFDEIADYIPKLYTSTQSINDIVRSAIRDNGVVCIKHAFVYNWYRSQYGIEEPVFDVLLDAVETYVRDLRVKDNPPKE